MSLHRSDDLKDTHTDNQQGDVFALFPLKSERNIKCNKYFFVKINEGSFSGKDILFTTRAFCTSLHLFSVVSGTLKWEDTEMRTAPHNLTVKPVTLNCGCTHEKRKTYIWFSEFNLIDKPLHVFLTFVKMVSTHFLRLWLYLTDSWMPATSWW